MRTLIACQHSLAVCVVAHRELFGRASARFVTLAQQRVDASGCRHLNWLFRPGASSLALHRTTQADKDLGNVP